jgi:hypothetical protein
MKAVLLILFCQSILAAAATNTIPFQATSLKLTKEMERLNKSEFFHSFLNEADGILVNQLRNNRIGDNEPLLMLGALRREKEGRLPTYSLDVIVHASEERKWIGLAETQAMVMVIDGAKYTIEPDVARYDLRYETKPQFWVMETASFKVPEEMMQTLGNAKRAQVKLDGERGSVIRNLSATNLARFKIFANVFIGKGQGAGATSPVKRE